MVDPQSNSGKKGYNKINYHLMSSPDRTPLILSSHAYKAFLWRILQIKYFLRFIGEILQEHLRVKLNFITNTMTRHPGTPHKKTWIRMKEAANCKMETNCFASFVNFISIYPAVKMVFRPFLQMEDIFWHSTKSQDVSGDARRKYGTCESKTSETDRWQYQLRYTSYRIYTVCGWKCPWTTGVNTHTHTRTLCSACINSPHW